MKKLEIVIRPENLEELEALLEEEKANGMMITNILGYGNQKATVSCTGAPRSSRRCCRR